MSAPFAPPMLHALSMLRAACNGLSQDSLLAISVGVARGTLPRVITRSAILEVGRLGSGKGCMGSLSVCFEQFYFRP